MQELVKIERQLIGVEETNAVDARDLHVALEINKKFVDWIKAQIDRAGLRENIDYMVSLDKVEAGKGLSTQTNYILTADAGKHIAMMSQGQKAHAVRDYFIAVEKAYKAEVVQHADLSPVLAEITRGLVEMNRTMQTIVETMQQMQSRVAATEIHLRHMNDTQKDVKEVMKSTYNYLKYMPLTREERIKLNMRIQRRGKELSDMHNVTLEVAVASIYRAMNKAYSLSSYHELDRKDFLSAYDFCDYVDISKGSEYYRSDIEDPMEGKYGVDVSERSRGKNIWGDYVDREF